MRRSSPRLSLRPVASSEYTRRLSRRRPPQRSPQSSRRSFKPPVCGSSPLCKSIKNKLDFWGLGVHSNVRFIAYGSQWLDWHKKENDQVAGASKQYNFQTETHSTGYISTNFTNHKGLSKLFFVQIT